MGIWRKQFFLNVIGRRDAQGHVLAGDKAVQLPYEKDFCGPIPIRSSKGGIHAVPFPVRRVPEGGACDDRGVLNYALIPERRRLKT